MKVAITAEGDNLDARLCPTFGRCPVYLFVDTDTMAFQALPNPGTGERGGAGIRAARFVVEQAARAVITGNIGPNAHEVLHQANVAVYLSSGPTVRRAVEAFKAGDLVKMSLA